MWLIVSSLAPHNLHLQFCCVWLIFVFNLIGFYGNVLCCYQKRISFSQGFPFVAMSRFYLVGRIFFAILEDFVLYCLTQSQYFFSLPFFFSFFLYVLIYHFHLYFQTFCVFFLILSSQYIFGCFPFLCTFAFCRSFFICLSSLIFHPGLVFSDSLEKYRFYHKLVSLLHKFTCLVQWCCMLFYLVIIYGTFRFLPSLFSILVLDGW